MESRFLLSNSKTWLRGGNNTRSIQSLCKSLNMSSCCWSGFLHVYFCALGWTLSRHPTASIWLRWSFWRTSTTCRPSWVWLKPSSSPGLLNMAEESQWNWCYTTMSWVPSAFLVTIKTMNKVTTNIVYSLSYFYYHYMISERVKREKINVWLIGIICFSKPCYIMSL